MLFMLRLRILEEGGPQGRRAVVVVSRSRDVDSIWQNGYFGTIGSETNSFEPKDALLSLVETIPPIPILIFKYL